MSENDVVVGQELERRPEILDPIRGELVAVADAPAVADLLDRLRSHKSEVLSVIRVCEEALIEESERVGAKTLHFGGRTARISGGSELEWDVSILEELLEAGLPTERYAELVSIEQTYKVSASVAKQLEASPRYAGIIERARSRRPTKARVSV